MIKYIIILLLTTCSLFAQVGIRDARVIGNMNIGTQYVLVNNQYRVSGFNIEKYYGIDNVVSLAVSVIDQDMINNNKVVKELPYVVYTTPFETVNFDYTTDKFLQFIRSKGYTEDEITFIENLLKLMFEW